MKSPSLAFVASVAIEVFSGCEVMNELSGYVTSSEFTYDSSAIEGGGANAGKDYVTGLVPNDESRSYFTKASVTESKKVVVSPGNDQGTGVEWTDDGGILIPPGVTIEFTNNGHCMDPHLPAPKSGEEMQFVKMSSLLPKKLQGTYKALQQRAAAGDEDVSANMQRLVWALRTSSSDDAMAKYLSEQQMEILQDCAASSSDFSDFSLDSIMKGIVTDMKTIAANTIAQATAVRIGNVTYNAFDLMDPDKCLEKVDAHAQALVDMSKNMPVSKTGFNYGQLASGIYTDVKGGRSDAPASGCGWLTFNAKIANATSQPYVFYANDYAAQVGSGDTSSEGVYYATSSTTMRQRITINTPTSVSARVMPFEEKLPTNASGTTPIFPAPKTVPSKVKKDDKKVTDEQRYLQTISERQYEQAIKTLIESGDDVDSTVEGWLAGFQENVTFYDEQLVRAESQLQTYKDLLSYNGYEIPQWVAETCLFINATPRVAAQGVEILTGAPIGTGTELFLTGVSDVVKGDNSWWREDKGDLPDDAKKYLDANLAVSGLVIDEVSKGAGKVAGGVVAGATTVGIVIETTTKQQTISERYAAKKQAELSVKSIRSSLEYNQAKYDALQAAYRKYKNGDR